MVLVGNKIDLESERTVSKEKGQELAKEFNCTFFLLFFFYIANLVSQGTFLESSAKYRTNVPEVSLTKN